MLDNWKDVLRKAWSVRLIILAAFLSGLEVAVQFLGDILPVEPGIFAAFAGVVSAFALLARVMAQSNIPENTDAVPEAE
jgi:hypothetical protein